MNVLTLFNLAFLFTLCGILTFVEIDKTVIMILASIDWNVNPDIFTLGPLTVRYYGLLFALAFVCSYIIMKKIFEKENLSIELLDSLTVYVALGTIIGARLGHCLFYQPDYYLSKPFEIIKIWKGGLASHGAAVGILLALFLFVRKHKKAYLWILDRIGIVVSISGFFVRMGNLMNSEIYGHETDLPWGFVFLRDHQTVPKHPTQIYEALSYLLIFVILYFLFHKKGKQLREGTLFSLFLIMLFTVRFFIEFVKEIQVDFEATMSLNMGQWLSIPFVLGGVVLFFYSLKNPRRAVV